MKKIISVLLSIALLCSFGVFVAAQEEENAKVPTVCVMAQNIHIVEQTDSTDFKRWDSLIVSVSNVENFERCEIGITLNTPPYKQMPVFSELLLDESYSNANCANSIELSADGNYIITLNAPAEHEITAFSVFAFTATEDVPLEFTVNSVKLYNTDGEIDQNDIVLDERRVNNGDFVQYDLNGDHKITAEDARLALRFAVGLDTATDAQCRAAGVYDADSFTSDLARFLLRAGVGLEGDVEKVVVNMEWVADGDTAYLVYHYSDGTYETVGPMDAQLGKPDWFECNSEKVVTQVEWVSDEETAYLLYHYSDGSYKVIGPLDAKSDRPDWL